MGGELLLLEDSEALVFPLEWRDDDSVQNHFQIEPSGTPNVKYLIEMLTVRSAVST